MKPATIPATLDSLGAIAEYVMAAAASAGLDKQASYRLRLAVDEIATNIIVHGYANVGHQGALELRAEIDDRTLTIAIDDTGATYDPRQTPIPDLNLPLEQRPIGGLGLLKRAIERVVTRLDIENASIILRDEERDELYVAQVADENRVGHERRLRGVRFPATHGIAGWVVRKGHSLIVPDVDQDPRVYRGIGVHAGTKTRSLVCVPVRTQERIIGVLQAINKRQGVFTAEDVRRLEALADELAPALEQARVLQERYNLDVQQLLAEAERPASRAAPFDILIGESPRMQEVARLVEGVRHTTATVLLTGERGTGKDLIARVLHAQGPRARGPFITVNCAALPETRLEAELFGDERGAGPGATQRQPGCLELAAGGTLFLDEIDALSPALQAKFLRVLQEKQFERVGGAETLATDARIVAATSQDLEQLVDEGKFRRDLYFRLNVYPIALPPLRERREDLRALALHLLTRSGYEGHTEALGSSKEAMKWLERYPWPGNVRELEEVIEGAVARGQGPTVTVQDLPQALREHSRAPGLDGDAFRLPPGGIELRELEKDLIRQALEQAHQNKSQAAKLLGLSRTQLRAHAAPRAGIGFTSVRGGNTPHPGPLPRARVQREAGLYPSATQRHMSERPRAMPMSPNEAKDDTLLNHSPHAATHPARCHSQLSPALGAPRS